MTKTLVSGHRNFKLTTYDKLFLNNELRLALIDLNTTLGLCGMADGIDLEFCRACEDFGIFIRGYVPFDQNYMSPEDYTYRQYIIDKYSILEARNSQMVEDCDNGIIIFDGNKGGTHNVFQQMLEKKKPFIWIEPNNRNIYKIN